MANAMQRAEKMLAELLPHGYQYKWFDREAPKPIVTIRTVASVPTVLQETSLSEYGIAQLVEHCETRCTLNTSLRWKTAGDEEGMILREMEVNTRVAVDEATPNSLQCAVEELQVSRERVSAALAEILATDR